jgi:uncharacterized membrane protein YhaH (DUF805 family)
MRVAIAMLKVLFDPRGRLSRSGLLISATVLLVIELFVLAHAPQPPASLPLPLIILKGLAIWIGVAGIIKRLHDADASGWWLLAGAGCLCVWSAVLAFGAVFTVGVEVFNPAASSHVILLGLLLLPALGMALWLHLAPGTSVANRYGAVPTGLIAVNSAAKPHVTA